MMITYGAYGARMTGSGWAVFGIYDSFEYATVACTMLKDKYTQVFCLNLVNVRFKLRYVRARRGMLRFNLLAR